MRLLMGISKNRHGTYYAVKKVPERLQEAVARVTEAVNAVRYERLNLSHLDQTGSRSTTTADEGTNLRRLINTKQRGT